MKSSLERTIVALVAVATLALPLVHGAAFALRVPLGGEVAALALSAAVVLATAVGALASAGLGSAAAVGAAGLVTGALPAAGLVALAGDLGAAAAVLLAGAPLALAVRAVAERLPQAWDGAVGRRPVAAAVWALLGVGAVAQTGRIASYVTDDTLAWGPTLPDYFDHHACLSAYLYAVELHDRGEPNVYDERHYPGLDPEAQPVTRVANMQPWVEDPYQYPPPFLLLPKAALALSNDYLAIRMGWFVLQALLFAGVAVGLARWVGGPAGRAAALALPLVWASVPTMFNLQYGQFHMATLLFAVAGMLAFERRREGLGGALLAVAIAAKLFPGVLLVPLAVQRRWRAVGWTLGWLGAFSLAALAVFGTAPFEAFLTYHLPRMASGEAFAFEKAWPDMIAVLAAGNQSPAGQVMRLEQLGVTGLSVGTANALFSGGLLALALFAGRVNGSRLHRARTWLALLALAAMRSPGAWAEYVNVVSLWLLTFALAELRGRRPVAAFMAASWVLIWFLPGVVPFPALPSPPVMMVLSTVVFAVAVALSAWGVVARPAGEAVTTEEELPAGALPGPA